MKWTYEFKVNASVESIYRSALTADRWFTFDKRYRGLESADESWPQVLSTIVIRLAVLGPLTVRLRQTVVEHEHGRLLRIHEEALAGLWIDDFQLRLEGGAQGARATITTEATSRKILLRPLVPLISWVLNWLTVPQSVRNFKAMVER